MGASKGSEIDDTIIDNAQSYITNLYAYYNKTPAPTWTACDEGSKLTIASLNELDTNLYFSIEGVSSRDKVLIMNSLEEIFTKVEDQRYILVNKKFRVSTYYNVPSVFSVNKEVAEVFYKNWSRYMGHTELVYTKSQKGRRILLEARSNSFDYTKDGNIFSKKKKALDEWS